jgi:hypothetical protein
MPFSKDRFIELITQANVAHWSAKSALVKQSNAPWHVKGSSLAPLIIKKANAQWKVRSSSMAPLINLLPSHGPVNKAITKQIQAMIWAVGKNPVWLQKKQKYRDALIYLGTEGLSMRQKTFERVLLKKGDQKKHWQRRVLPRDWSFTHVSQSEGLTELDPRQSTEFCYPEHGQWSDWPANEFVFCTPALTNQKAHTTFGDIVIEFTVPAHTPYLCKDDITVTRGEVAFYHRLLLHTDPVLTIRPT